MDRCIPLISYPTLGRQQDTTHQEFFLFFLRRFVVEATSLNDLVIDIELVSRTSVHGFFDALLGNETENTNSLGLTDTVSTILSLKISVRIPAASLA